MYCPPSSSSGIRPVTWHADEIYSSVTGAKLPLRNGCMSLLAGLVDISAVWPRAQKTCSGNNTMSERETREDYGDTIRAEVMSAWEEHGRSR